MNYTETLTISGSANILSGTAVVATTLEIVGAAQITVNGLAATTSDFTFSGSANISFTNSNTTGYNSNSWNSYVFIPGKGWSN